MQKKVYIVVIWFISNTVMKPLLFAVLSTVVAAREQAGGYFGSYIGAISNKEQGISGQLYCIDKSTVYLRNFTYTGTGSGKA